jgi:hypothetical protein
LLHFSDKWIYYSVRELVLYDGRRQVMRVPKHPTLIASMTSARIKRLKATGPVLAASLVTIKKHCGRAGCHCQRGEKHIGHYLTYKEKGKTHTVYVPLDLLGEVKAWIAEHRRLRRLAREISQLSIARVRGHVTARRRRAGRS